MKRLVMMVLPFGLLLGCSDLGDAPAATGPDPEPEVVSFQSDIQPILQANCVGCHGGPSGFGGLDLSSLTGLLAGGNSGPAVEAGDAADGELPERILETDPAERMPPGGQLPQEAIDAILEWINDGALDN